MHLSANSLYFSYERHTKYNGIPIHENLPRNISWISIENMQGKYAFKYFHRMSIAYSVKIFYVENIYV